MAKLWKGRFSKELDSRVNDFNSSVSFDSAMYREDITGSIAHVSMLGRRGSLPPMTQRRSQANLPQYSTTSTRAS